MSCGFAPVARARALERRRKVPATPSRFLVPLAPFSRLEPQLPRRLLEERRDALGVRPFARPPRSEARVVHLAAARLPHPPEDPVGAERKVRADAFLEDVLHGAGEAEEHVAGEDRPRVLRGLEDAADLLVAEPRDHRCGHHPDAYSAGGEAFDRPDAPLRRSHIRLHRPRFLGIPKRHAHRDAHARHLRERLEDVDVALDERRFRDDAARVLVLRAHLEAAAREPVGGLERLVAVGHAAEDDELSPPRRLLERLPEQLRRGRLHDDAPLEVGPRAEREVLVGGACVAVGAGVEAAAVRVHAPGEAEVGAVVLREDRARRVLVDVQRRVRRFPLEVRDFGRRPGVRGIGEGEGDHLQRILN